MCVKKKKKKKDESRVSVGVGVILGPGLELEQVSFRRPPQGRSGVETETSKQ